MDHDEKRNGPFGPDHRVTVFMLFLLIAAFAWLSYGPGLDAGLTGYGAFFAIPAAIGGLIAQMFVYEKQSYAIKFFLYPIVGLVVLTLIAAAAFGEGAICIAMILPLWIPAAFAGTLVSLWNEKRRRDWEMSASRFQSAAWLIIPIFLILHEDANPPEWQERSVERQVVIDATPEIIWPLLESIPNIADDEGEATLVHNLLGVPRPTNATLRTEGDVVVRSAEWGSEIRFDEVISRQDAGKILGWKFSFPDASVQTHTDQHISPDGAILKIDAGQYQLTPLSDGKTMLSLTTTYSMRTRLAWYHAWWGERLLGGVQSNILTIIADRSEG